MYGNKIKELRNEKGLTQKELADILNFNSASAIGMIEREEREVNFDILIKIAEFFNVTIDYLLGVNSAELAKEVQNIDDGIKNGKKIASKLSIIPEEFINPDEARAYVNSHQIFGAHGFNSNKLDDNEILEFANELLNQMQMVSFKYKK